jgi:hypothetical protein
MCVAVCRLLRRASTSWAMAWREQRATAGATDQRRDALLFQHCTARQLHARASVQSRCEVVHYVNGQQMSTQQYVR